MHNQTIDPAAPEWASRLLKIREAAAIVGENPATIYRKIDAGIYPKIVHFGSSARLPGWKCWACVKAQMAGRDEPAPDGGHARIGKAEVGEVVEVAQLHIAGDLIGVVFVHAVVVGGTVAGTLPVSAQVGGEGAPMPSQLGQHEIEVALRQLAGESERQMLRLATDGPAAEAVWQAAQAAVGIAAALSS